MKIWAFLVGIFLLSGLFWSVWSVGNIAVTQKQISVHEGQTVLSLREILHLDVASWRYRAYIRFFADAPKLQVGTFHLSGSTTLRDALKWPLQKPSTTDITITLLPGWNVYDIDAYLSADGIISKGSLIDLDPKVRSGLESKFPFLKEASTLEGMIYPDTYRIRSGAKIAEILSTVFSTFDDRIYSKIPSKNKKDWYDTLILASIVEREERDPDNKPIVAGVLAKRLREGIALGADATLCYALHVANSACTPSMIVENLSLASPYNTRKNAGLPPTPISNPSRETWLATLSSEDSPYYYYLHDADGTIHFAKTLEEHNANKTRYLR